MFARARLGRHQTVAVPKEYVAVIAATQVVRPLAVEAQLAILSEWDAGLVLILTGAHALSGAKCPTKDRARRRRYLLRVLVDLDRAPAEVVTAYGPSKLISFGGDSREGRP